jgi:hypothetical protein
VQRVGYDLGDGWIFKPHGTFLEMQFSLESSKPATSKVFFEMVDQRAVRGPFSLKGE